MKGGYNTIFLEEDEQMDVQKFGAFIAENRKLNGMTQADLAKKILVSDKAVSRWERGKGFPDINTIEPLASALKLSVLEIMKSKRCQDDDLYEQNILEIMKSTAAIEKRNRRQEQTAVALGIFTTIIITIIFYFAGFGNFGGSLIFGAVVSIVQIALYYYMEDRDDVQSRKINAFIGIVALIIIVILLTIVI